MKEISKLTTASALMLGLMLTGCDSSDSSTDSSDSTDSTTETSVTYTVIDTGQSDCYDGDGQGGEGANTIVCGSAYNGQDAEYGENEAAFDFEFLTDDDGEIIYETQTYDNGDYTGGAVVVDNNTGLMWQGVPTTERYSYEEAEAQIETLNDEALGGYSDWRMPTMKELYSISDFSVGWPYIDQDFFTLPTYVENDYDPIDFDAKNEQYWSQAYIGNTYEAGSEGDFGLNHGTGHIKVYPGTTTGDMAKAVRAVRGTENVYGVSSFTVNESDDGNTVTDSATGLMWTQNDAASGDLLIELNRLITAGTVDITDGDDTTDGAVGVIGLLNWEDALAFAENAEFGGYTDWRLPSIKELQTIFDYDHAPTAGFYRYEDPATASTEDESTDEEELGGPSEDTSVDYIWYDACDADTVTAQGDDGETASDDECDARGPAIDSDYFAATSINDIMVSGLAAEVMSEDGDLYALYNVETVQQGLNDYGYYWSSTSTRYGTNDEDDDEDNTEAGDGYRDTDYAFAWYASVGSAVNGDGEDYHGAGAIRYDVKDEDSGAVGEDAERIFNFVRLVRDAD